MSGFGQSCLWWCCSRLNRAAVAEQEANRSVFIIYLSSNSGPEQSKPLGNQLGRDLFIYNCINYIANKPASPHHLCAHYSSSCCKDEAWATQTSCVPIVPPVPVVTRSSWHTGVQWGAHPVMEVCPHSRSFQKVLDKTARLNLLQGLVRLKSMLKPHNQYPWSHWKLSGLLGCWGEWLISLKQSLSSSTCSSGSWHKKLQVASLDKTVKY